MTGCEEIRPLISSYVDGEASTEEVSLVQAHLKTCDKCQSHLAFLKMLGPAINHAPIAAPSPLLFERIAKATYAKPTWQQRYLGWLAPIPLRWTVTSGLVAAGVVAVLVAPRVMNMTPETTDTTNIAFNNTVKPPVAIDGTMKPAASPTPVPDVARPSVVLPTPAPIAAKPAEPNTHTRTDRSIGSESSAARIAAAPKVKSSPKVRVEATSPAKSAGSSLVNTAPPKSNGTNAVTNPASIPTPAPKVTVDEPILTASAPERNSSVASPSAAVSKTVNIAANTIKPETPAFTASTTSATPDPEAGRGGPKPFDPNIINTRGANTPPPGYLISQSQLKPLASNSANLPIAADSRQK